MERSTVASRICAGRRFLRRRRGWLLLCGARALRLVLLGTGTLGTHDGVASSPGHVTDVVVIDTHSRGLPEAAAEAQVTEAFSGPSAVRRAGPVQEDRLPVARERPRRSCGPDRPGLPRRCCRGTPPAAAHSPEWQAVRRRGSPGADGAVAGRTVRAAGRHFFPAQPGQACLGADPGPGRGAVRLAHRERWPRSCRKAGIQRTNSRGG